LALPLTPTPIVILRQERHARRRERLVDGINIPAARGWETVLTFYALDGRDSNA
jgi:hypothetical protein